jgi:hypothetical protein
MSGTEILEELPRLKSEERYTIFLRLNELEAAEIEETPAMLAAIDGGIASLKQRGGIPLEVVERRFEAKWRSS